MKKAKKGFTIVELVVVIAVIAILAAVLIPTFISIVNRAKVSNDNQLVRNLNTALITEEADGNKAENMSQAIEIAEDYGYKLENLQAKADGYVLLWNQTTNRFYVESVEGTITSNPEVTDFPAENYTYWEISKTLGKKHSTYLTEGSGDIEAINLGVDVSGISSAVNVTYTGNSNKVIIATNGGDLSVNAENGHVAHYGFVKNLTVTAVNGADCYREHGYVGTLESFGTGKFVAEKGSQFHQTEEQIKTAVKPESNTFVDLGATYGVHKRDETGICVICNDGGTSSAKNGLVDGYYYKDNDLYTGTETDNGTTYTFENGVLVLNGEQGAITAEGSWLDSGLSFCLPNNVNYLTNKIKLRFEDNNDYMKPGSIGGYEMHIVNSFGVSYTAVNVKANFTEKIFDAISDLRKAILEGNTNNILSEIENKYGITKDFYPLLVASDDFQGYLSTLNISNISSKEEYDLVNNASIRYEDYLKNKYQVSHLWEMNWDDIVAYASQGDWPSSNVSSKNGIFDGNYYSTEYRSMDPEIILLFWEHTYSQVFYIGLSEEDPTTLLKAAYAPNPKNNFYKYGDADWMTKVSNQYGVTLFSHKQCYDGKMITISNDSFFMFTAMHGFLMSNSWQETTFSYPTFDITLERSM